MHQSTDPAYDADLRAILIAGDWEALREFSRRQNQVPDEIYAKDEHFWNVLLHKIVCNRLDLAAMHAEARRWLTERGYTSDLGGY